MRWDWLLLALLGVVCVSTTGLTLALYSVLTRERRLLLRRLNPYHAHAADAAAVPESVPLSVLRHRRFSNIAGIDRLLAQRDFAERIALDLARAGVPLRVGEYLFLLWACGLGIFTAVLAVTDSTILATPAGIAGFFLPRFYVRHRERSRVSRFNEQLVDAIVMITNSLKSGYGFLQGIRAVTRELPDPAAAEFSQLLQELTMGTPAEEALTNLTQRVRSKDLDMVVTAMLIQRQAGGNLAEILDNIAYTIRERLRIQREVRTLTAQERMSGYIIGAMPVFLLVLLSFANRSYVDVLISTPIGHLMLVAAAVLEVIGFLIINRIVAIDV
ncbi:MAG: type II secretion system F family protein [Chloroflexi bacterium]|nr:type II secretion system F family protein [Chloroflexota bacterium]